MPRIFSQQRIEELEALFEEQKYNTEFLRALQEELSYRKTKRAARLRHQVEAQLATPRGTPKPPRPNPQNTRTLTPGRQQRSSRSTEERPSNSSQSSSEEGSSSSEIPVIRPTSPLPPITNQPEEILSAWTALEVLSPPSYIRPEDLASGDKNRVSKLNEMSLPWERGAASRPNYRLYYQVVLGSIKMEPAVEKLIARYGDTRPEKPGVREKAALAVVIVDSKGRLVESPAVGISSFGWGVMSALKGELADLAWWSEVEPQLVEKIEKLLLTSVGGDKAAPVTSAALFTAYQTLVNELGLPNDWLEPPEFAIRSYTYFKDPNPPEPLLLNSFFLADLASARKLFSEGKAPQNLRRYLGIERPQRSLDLLCNTGALTEAISPRFTPLARWPEPGRFPLVLLQQAAVNLAFRETKTGGLLGINGPPGTGKTTLLRDIVAGVVTARAEAMAKFDDPATAFENSGQRLRAGNGWIHLYQLNASLRGFEIVVASSNNKAVENVSAELPGLNAIADDATELRYFKTLSDALHQTETWGAIAAVLGNGQNRSRFKQTFWWDDDNGLNSYLRAAAGSVPQSQITDLQTGQVSFRIPHIVENENPPSTHQETLDRWEGARKKFLNALEKSRQWQMWLENLNDDLGRLPKLAQAEADAAVNQASAVEAIRQVETAIVQAQQTEIEDARQLQIADQELRSHGLAKPRFWARLFRTRPAREWSKKLAMLRASHNKATTQHAKASVESLRLKEELLRVQLDRQKAEETWQSAATKHQQAKQRLVEANQKHGIVLADSEFFTLAHAKRHQMTPWFPPAAQRLRDEIFISAMALHRAFIDAAAKPLRHNLGALMNAFTTQTLPGAEKQALLPDLWASLFLVVPLVSTTFASVNRMLGKLPVESLGWLLVDEAGQALPQAAVGALLRTRRAVVVGDPVQIQPIVMLPDELTHAICRRFGVEPEQFAAPSASVQTLADAASTYTSEFQTLVGSRSVGVPLLVHRRCSEPMFSVSNAIAYSGLMVAAKSPRPSTIRDVLGPSRWIHVQGSGQDKWCQQEGTEVLRLLGHLSQSGVKPDLYIVTPFVIVADQLRKTLCASGVLKNWAGGNDWRWAYERIGTVHTVQGREAEAVIFVLGAPDPLQTGARGWAGGRPNLLNVAVTRAKEVIYVIGNRQLWREAGLFRELDKSLPLAPRD